MDSFWLSVLIVAMLGAMLFCGEIAHARRARKRRKNRPDDSIFAE